MNNNVFICRWIFIPKNYNLIFFLLFFDDFFPSTTRSLSSSSFYLRLIPAHKIHSRCFHAEEKLNDKNLYTYLFFNFLAIQVLRILAWDTLNHLVYYLGTQDKKPGQQHLYIVKDPVNEDPRR